MPLGDRVGQSLCLNTLGVVYRRMGRHVEARDCLLGGLVICGEHRDRLGEGNSLHEPAIVSHLLGN